MADDGASMPPPPARAAALSNADFRAMLATPRRDAGSSGGGGGAAAPKPRKAADKKKPPKPKPKAEGDEEEGAPVYRDRAAERRQGLNPDYLDLELGALGAAASASAGGGVLASAPDAGRPLTADETKYLGGDVDHTHLVRGLDYALLQKVRGEMIRPHSSGTAGGGAPSPRAARARAPPPTPGRPATTTRLGAAVVAALLDPPPPTPPAAAAFLPRRTAFVYELDEWAFRGGPADGVPTTLRRAAADCPKPPDALFARLDGAMVDRLSRIMAYLKGPAGGKKGKKLRAKERGSAGAPAGTGGVGPPGSAPDIGDGATSPPPPADADDDIFGDAGREYEIALPHAAVEAGVTAAAAAAGGRAGGGYFGDGGAALEDVGAGVAGPSRPVGVDAAAAAYAAYGDGSDGAGETGPQRPAGVDTAAAAYAAYGDGDGELGGGPPAPPPPPPPPRSGPALGDRAGRARPGDDDDDDAYAELFPGYAGFSGFAQDSDDEGEGGPKKAGPAEPGPDADARPPRPGAGRHAARKAEAKLDSQLGAIKEVLEREGRAGGHAGAFEPERRRGGGRGGGGGEGGGGTAGFGGENRKKRRLGLQ